MTIDLGQVAREVGLPLDKVERTVALLDDGNTVPFVTRYRKDHTGGLDEEQIRRIQHSVSRRRMLAERKQTIRKSIESQGKLTPELAAQIDSADSTKRLEDLYLPYKPKKRTLATIARERGLDPLAREILNAAPAAQDLDARAADFISEDRQLLSGAEVLLGVGHLLAERFSERADLRERLRHILHKSGKLLSVAVTPPAAPPAQSSEPVSEPVVEQRTERAGEQQPEANQEPESSVAERVNVGRVDEAATADSPAAAPLEPDAAPLEPVAASTESTASVSESDAALWDPAATSPAPAAASSEEEVSASLDERPAGAGEPVAEVAESSVRTESSVHLDAAPSSSQPPARLPKPAKKPNPPRPKLSKKDKKQQKLVAAFKDYFHFEEALNKLPPHRVLAINRGERARILRVRIEADVEAMTRAAEELVVPVDHPHRDFLCGCVRDSLQRLVIPALEREVRRELTDQAEQHAIDVFIQNLRKLLLQPPVRNRRVLAIDPGLRSGCRMIALDEFGNVLAHEVIHVVGKDGRRPQDRRKLAELVRQFDLRLISIGNGAGCRETEQMVASVIADELKDLDVSFLITNEAGASVYSTSPVGREELPRLDASLRSAVSIGRRVLDPLSELVKINPSNIGVGLYQHDVKAKHLRSSLDDVVESCVNYVGVDVNTASPALLRYVSGLNQLTARRIYEHRCQHGPFRNREQLKDVPGLGEATFVQAAGFLKVLGGDNPLDVTWIHPESYAVARQVLDKLGSSVDELARAVPPPPPPPPPPAVAAETPPSPPPEPAAPPESSQALDTDQVSAAEITDPSAALDAAATELPAAAPELPAAGAPEPIVESEPPAVSAPEPNAESEPSPTPVPPVPDAPAVPDTPSPATTPAALAPKVAEPPEWARRLAAADVRDLAGQLGVGELLLRDILSALRRPGRDPREDLPSPVLRRGIMKLEDLKPGMELSGTVLNVVDFGAFVDIGLTDSGLIHISRLADRYVRDPHEVVSVGDILRVWVVEVDKQRRRVSLTAIQPGTERPVPPKHPPREGQAGGGRQRSEARKSRPPQQGGGQRPPRPPQPAQAKASRPRPEKPKPVKPITKEMEEGVEPMRSFSDLMQFYTKKKEPPSK